MKTVMKKLTDQKNFTANLNSTTVKKVNILMVDDHPENLLAMEAVLKSSNYNLFSATSGKEALKYMIQHEFAVILLDVQMPGLNGFETARLIKEREKTKHIPIIFITAISQDIEHVRHGYSVGAIDYIFKPFHPDTLRKKIEQFVQLHQQHEEKMTQSELKRSIELKEVNQKLNKTTLDLRRMEAIAKVAGETLMDTVVTFDAQGNILTVNPAVKKMFGYEIEELFGKDVLQLFQYDKDAEHYVPTTDHSFPFEATGKVMELVAIRKNGSIFPVDIQIGETEIEGQQIFVCTIRDVSERKQIEEIKAQQFHNMEKAVQERTLELLLANKRLQKEIEQRKKIAKNLYVSQERFRSIFESSPCLMAIFSLKNNIYLDVNTSWGKVIGYSCIELNNSKITLQTLLEDNTNGDIHLEQPVRNKKISYKTKKGEIRAGLLSTELIDIHSEPCVLIVLTDITERVLLEKELSRLDRLNLIGEMAAGIAHEIRNPMTTVYGFLQVAKNSSDVLPREILELMLDELDRANSIITEFLNLAKNKVSDKRMQNLNSIIETLFPLIQAEALRSSKHVVLDLSKCPDLSLDEKEIRQFILNMVLNGLDAMEAGGKLTIKSYKEKQSVTLEIKDEGAGISPETLEKMGTPFFTTKENGTGLGLAICYSIAERHQADIEIETGETGTTFFVRFKAI